MNANRRAIKRAEHKRFSKERQLRRCQNKQSWLENKLNALGDQTDEAIANLIGRSLDWVNKYRYGYRDTWLRNK